MSDTINCLYLSDQEKEILHDVLTYYVDNGKLVVVPPNSLNERLLWNVMDRLRHGDKSRPRLAVGWIHKGREWSEEVFPLKFIDITEPSDVEAAWQELNNKT